MIYIGIIELLLNIFQSDFLSCSGQPGFSWWLQQSSNAECRAISNTSLLQLCGFPSKYARLHHLITPMPLPGRSPQPPAPAHRSKGRPLCRQLLGSESPLDAAVLLTTAGLRSLPVYRLLDSGCDRRGHSGLKVQNILHYHRAPLKILLCLLPRSRCLSTC